MMKVAEIQVIYPCKVIPVMGETYSDIILESAVSFMEEKLYSSHINPQLGVKRRDGDHSKLYHTNY